MAHAELMDLAGLRKERERIEEDFYNALKTKDLESIFMNVKAIEGFMDKTNLDIGDPLLYTGSRLYESPFEDLDRYYKDRYASEEDVSDFVRETIESYSKVYDKPMTQDGSPYLVMLISIAERANDLKVIAAIDDNLPDFVEWLRHEWEYEGHEKLLYTALIERYNEETLDFLNDFEYDQSTEEDEENIPLEALLRLPKERLVDGFTSVDFKKEYGQESDKALTCLLEDGLLCYRKGRYSLNERHPSYFEILD